MKKLMFAAVAGLCATVACADVSSANVVGYDQVEVFNGQMNLLNAPWQTILNENGKVELQSCMSREGLISLGVNYEMGDYINTWNFELGTWGNPYYYVDQPVDFGPEYTDVWCNWLESDPIPDTTNIPANSGFWYYACDTVTLTFINPVAK